jgi:hypothetical protein
MPWFAILCGLSEEHRREERVVVEVMSREGRPPPGHRDRPGTASTDNRTRGRARSNSTTQRTGGRQTTRTVNTGGAARPGTSRV